SIGQARTRRKLKNDAVVARKTEGDSRMSDRLQMHLMLDVPAFSVFRAQEFPARRHVVKKLAYFHLRSGCFAAVAHDADLSAIHDDLRSGNCLFLASR